MKISEWGERLLGFAVSCLVAALLLSWAWSIIRPRLPVLVIGALIYGVVRYVLQRRRTW